MRIIESAPTEFIGTVADLFDNHMSKVLPEPSVVREYHNLLMEYVDKPNSKLFVRKMKLLQRGCTYESIKGTTFTVTDNSPAWWIHRQAFDAVKYNSEQFSSAIKKMPCQFLMHGNA